MSHNIPHRLHSLCTAGLTFDQFQRLPSKERLVDILGDKGAWKVALRARTTQVQFICSPEDKDPILVRLAYLVEELDNA